MLEPTPNVWLPSTLQPERALEQDDVKTARATAHYWWAWCHVKRQNFSLVYDMGCQSGYGSRILTVENQATVVGFDSSPAALAYAKGEHFVPERNTFRCVDFDGEWDSILGGASPQLVVVFDLLPRLRHRDLFLLTLTKILPEDGWAFFSVWEPAVSPASHIGDALPYQVHYSMPDLRHLLEGFFTTVCTRGEEPFPESQYYERLDAYAASAHNAHRDKHRGLLFGRYVLACHRPRRS